jgi:hypothetical protein
MLLVVLGAVAVIVTVAVHVACVTEDPAPVFYHAFPAQADAACRANGEGFRAGMKVTFHVSHHLLEYGPEQP